jgi:hypothetical protein
LFDRAFLQVGVAGWSGDTLIADALECAPKSDLLTRLVAALES